MISFHFILSQALGNTTNTMATQRRQRITRDIYTKRIRDETRKNDEIREFNSQLKREAMMTSLYAAQDRVDDKRECKNLARQHQERMMDEQIIRAREMREQRERQAEQEEKLAMEMEKIKLEKIRDEKRRDQIKNNSEELRELEAKLRTGYMNRERAAQIAEKRAIRMEELQREAAVRKVMETETKRAAIESEQRDVEKYQEMMQYRKDIENQLEDNEQKKQEAYEEFLKEKLMIDEIVRKIYEEDERNEQMRIEKMNATKRYIDEFKRTRDEWRRSEKARFEEENKKILRYAEQQRQREEERNNALKKDFAQKQALVEALGEKLYAERLRKEEMENVQIELNVEEQREADLQAQQAEKERQFRLRIQMQEDYAREMHFKVALAEQQRAEDENFRILMTEKFAEDDRIHQMNAQKRRMKQLEHKRQIQALLEERQRAREQEKLDEQNQWKERQAMEQARLEVVEQERQRLLKEHATKLLGYLPKGVLEKEQDLALFDSNFQNEYAKRRRDPFDDSLE